MTREELREKLAASEHDRWSRWLQYMAQRGQTTTTENAPHESLAHRWWRLSKTDYADLTEAEKESDRAEADRTLALLEEAGVLSHWIPMTPQTMPPIGTKVLGRVIRNYEPEPFITTVERAGNSQFWANAVTYSPDEVTHWQPLPADPEGVSDV